MTALTKESSHVEGVDATIVVAVDAAVGSERAKVEAGLELTLEDIETTHKINLLLEDVEEGTLDVVWERVVTTDEARWAIQGLVSQEVVSAGQEHLQEILEGESTILIRVEESHQAVSLRLVDGVIALVAKVGGDLVGSDR